MSLEKVSAQRACETCGRIFVGRPRQSQRFCGPRCQARSYRRRGAAGGPGPAVHQVYRCFDEHDALLYVGCSANALTRLTQHRTASGWFWQARKVMIAARALDEPRGDYMSRAIRFFAFAAGLGLAAGAHASEMFDCVRDRFMEWAAAGPDRISKQGFERENRLIDLVCTKGNHSPDAVGVKIGGLEEALRLADPRTAAAVREMIVKNYVK